MRRSLALALVVLGLLAACGGGGGQPTVPAKVGADTAKLGAASDGDAPAPEPPRKPCADGSCVECGDGVCPAGFYCERAKGAVGCAWAAPCAEKPSCACLAPHVKGCACEDKGGTAFVSCAQP